MSRSFRFARKLPTTETDTSPNRVAPFGHISRYFAAALTVPSGGIMYVSTSTNSY